MRCATATLFDLAIAAGVGALALVLVESAATIFALLLSSTGHFSHVSGAVAGASGLLPALAYLLCRDAIRLRFRRSIGKAMFDLRPLATGVADPGAMPLRALIERNSPWLAVAILVLLFARYGQEDRGGYLPATTSVGYGLLLGAGLAILLLLANVAFGWFKGRATLIDNWSKTRVIDADCAESLAIRP